MPLSSNRRQDYEHSRWYLGNSISEFLAISPEYGTRAVIDAVIGQARTKGYGEPEEPDVIDLGSVTIKFRGTDFEFNAWDEKGDDTRSRDDDVLARYVAFLRSCDEGSFGLSIAAASRDYATASVWTRILGVASERVEPAVVTVSVLRAQLVERPVFQDDFFFPFRGMRQRFWQRVQGLGSGAITLLCEEIGKGDAQVDVRRQRIEVLRATACANRFIISSKVAEQHSLPVMSSRIVWVQFDSARDLCLRTVLFDNRGNALNSSLEAIDADFVHSCHFHLHNSVLQGALLCGHPDAAATVQHRSFDLFLVPKSLTLRQADRGHC